MALCIIEGLSLSDSTVNVGDTLEVVVRSNRTRDSGTLLIGRDPKAACIECDLACAPDSDHIVSRRFSHGVPVEFQVTEEWLREGERRNPADPSLTVEVSCRGTDGAKHICNLKNTIVHVREAPPPPSPEFVVRSVDAPSQVDLGNSATVTVSVGNTGDGSGTATVQVSANGSLVGGRSVTLSPGQSRDVGFTWTPGATGTFTLTGRANGSTGTASVEVQEAPPPPPPPPEEECTVPIPVLGDVNCVVAAAGVGGLGLLGTVMVVK